MKNTMMKVEDDEEKEVEIEQKHNSCLLLLSQGRVLESIQFPSYKEILNKIDESASINSILS
jgi:hypothetical protein